MRIMDADISRGRNKTLKQNERIMWERTRFISLGIVLEVKDKKVVVKLVPSLSYVDYDMKSGYREVNRENEIVECIRVVGLDIQPEDIVLVVFTDLDSRRVIEEVRNGKSTKESFNTSNTSFHDVNYGIIVNKVDI